MKSLEIIRILLNLLYVLELNMSTENEKICVIYFVGNFNLYIFAALMRADCFADAAHGKAKHSH